MAAVACHLRLERRIPRGSHGDGHGKNSAKTVNDVVAKNERNMQPGFLDCEVLQAVDRCRISDEQERSHFPAGHRFFDLFPRVENKDLAQLSDLFFRCHFLQE